MPGTDSYLGEPSAGRRIPTTLGVQRHPGVETHLCFPAEGRTRTAWTRSARATLLLWWTRSSSPAMASAGEAEAQWLARNLGRSVGRAIPTIARSGGIGRRSACAAVGSGGAARGGAEVGCRPVLLRTVAGDLGARRCYGMVVRRSEIRGRFRSDDLAPMDQARRGISVRRLERFRLQSRCTTGATASVRSGRSHPADGRRDRRQRPKIRLRRLPLQVSRAAWVRRWLYDRALAIAKRSSAGRGIIGFSCPAITSRAASRIRSIYYFHGHSDRYTLERYDNGTDTVPKILSWVGANQAIVVAMDGYVARDYTGFYGGTPYDVRVEGGDFDFGEYFKELVAHVDSTYRTLKDARHRGTSGLSMGGFMSLWLSARYPDLIGVLLRSARGRSFMWVRRGRRVAGGLKIMSPIARGSQCGSIRASGELYQPVSRGDARCVCSRLGGGFQYRRDEYHQALGHVDRRDVRFSCAGVCEPASRGVAWSRAGAYDKAEIRGWQIEERV